MKKLFDNFKPYGILIVIMTAGLTMTACSGQQSSEATETEEVEQVAPASSEHSQESNEHPQDSNEHPSDDASEEHVDDTTSATWKEDY